MEEPLIKALERRRERYNALFTAARMHHPRIDGDAFLGHLRDTVAPIVAAVHALDPCAVDDVTDALYAFSLELHGRQLLSRGPLLTIWQDLLPALARFLCENPTRLLIALTNASHNLEREHLKVSRWASDLRDIAPLCENIDELLATGQVLAWRVGMAHWRDSALEIWSGLREVLQNATLLERDKSPEELRRRLANRWHDPALGPPPDPSPDGLRLVARTGGFIGLGGPFRTPPRVVAVDDALFAWSEGTTSTIHADVFGVIVRRYADDAIVMPAAPPHDELRQEIGLQYPALARATSIATTSHTVAVTVAHSHHVFLFSP
jgi:hypothetical protein